MEPLVCVIMINWNRFDDTKECIHSVLDSTYKNVKILVLDNGSTGDDVKKLRETFGELVTVIPLGRNLGYSGAVNYSIKKVKELGIGYTLYLDNDAVIEANSIERIVRSIQSDDKIGIVSAEVFSFYDRNYQQYAGNKISLWRDMILPSVFAKKAVIRKGEEDSLIDANHTSFWCTLVKTEVFDKIGGISESYFWGWEEIEFCFNTVRQGWRIVINTNTRIYHKARSSSNGSNKNKRLQYYSNRNKFLVMANLTPKWDYSLFVIYTIFIHFWLMSFYHLAIKRNWSGFSGMAEGIYDGMVAKRFGVKYE